MLGVVRGDFVNVIQFVSRLKELKPSKRSDPGQRLVEITGSNTVIDL